MIKSKKKMSNIYCTNCGIMGHSFKNCSVPITSYGVVLLSLNINDDLKKKLIDEFSGSDKKHKIDTPNGSNGISINGPNDIELFCSLKNSIKFLLIRRKHTLGFLEFIRGRYNIENVDGIIFLFKQMTPDEINRIRNLTFDELWDDVWGDKQYKSTSIYYNEFLSSKEKFNKLKNDDSNSLSLNFYTENVVPVWEFAEWGFPKGRRNMKENNMTCAVREFEEESGFCNDDFILLDGVDPIEETLIGTNGVNYRHIYYVALSTTDKEPSINALNKTQADEVGDIRYMNYEDTVQIVRPHHTDRQKIITQVYIYFINYLINEVNCLGK